MLTNRQTDRQTDGQTISYDEANSPVRNFVKSARKRQKVLKILYVPDDWFLNNGICSSVSPSDVPTQILHPLQ
jgi:hypothetical protein